MDLLFSFLEPNRNHSALLAGYFSKVVVCLMMRKTISLMNYVKIDWYSLYHCDLIRDFLLRRNFQRRIYFLYKFFHLPNDLGSLQAHQEVFKQLVDLIGITSIMEVLVRLVGSDDHLYPNSFDVMQWLADSNLLEMIVDKLNNTNPAEVHANAAETLCAITRNPQSPLATKLSSPSFVERVFGHALENSPSTSALVHSLSVCISILDPKRSISSSVMHAFRSQHVYEPPAHVKPDTVGAMLPKLGEMLMLLNVTSDEKVLPTTYGELRPPLGQYRLKVVEFLAVLLKTGNEVAEKELVGSGTIRRVFDLFFEYPYNNALHHHVESIIYSCLESKNSAIIDHLLLECNLVGRILESDRSPNLSCENNLFIMILCSLMDRGKMKVNTCFLERMHIPGEQSIPTKPASGKHAPRAGYFGHLTRIANKLVQLGNSVVQTHLQENSEWNEWQKTVLQERGMIENVYRWACGSAVTLIEFPLPIFFKKTLLFNWTAVAKMILILALLCSRPTALQDRTRDSDEEPDVHDRDYDVAALANNLSQAFRYNIYDNDDNEGHGSLDRDDEDVYFDDESAEVVISSLRLGDEQGSLFTNSNWFAFQDDRIGENIPIDTSASDTLDGLKPSGGSSSGSDDDVVVGDDIEIAAASTNGSLIPGTTKNPFDEIESENGPHNDDPFGDRPVPEWVAWGEGLGEGSTVNPFDDPNINIDDEGDGLPNGTSSSSEAEDSSHNSVAVVVPSLFEEDVEFVGVEVEGTEKAMEQALKEGIVGEAGPLKRNLSSPKKPETEESGGSGMDEFNDANYWRVDQEVTVLE
ncbi:SIT4 phosphatase-associated family protein [Striga asiatica]|uniref:SIT4 phosphatase-associated family protein n=1 Tax=Striga asiatica TaxID=4170 RepID=A0A5A7PLP1_STRAF|nr:SIT4 phosphatase-associated family protein [Striga asiatica]